MLELKQIKKSYRIGDIETKALDGISIAFRKQEFVAILGASGSGKTTALNIIGGLDRYDSGDLVIKGKHTKDFSERDWDAYRNNAVGFVFQNYNLISHLSIIENVELGMTLSGIKGKQKRQKAIEMLTKVGLKEHLHKKPNQLSGGQMQRVAIARALANDPEILLCDEPTGALDSETSVQIMDLITEISAERLVIMVTHNPDLAKQYADRLVQFADGKIISDSNPYQVTDESVQFKMKQTSMSFFTALRLSFNNIMTKKGRTFLTSFASSIGIIGIAVILSLSTGFQSQIDQFQSDALAEFPIMISQQALNIDEEQLKKQSGIHDTSSDDTEYSAVYLYDPADSVFVHQNKINQDFLTYLDQMSTEDVSSIGYTYATKMNLVRQTEEGVIPVSFSLDQANGQGGTQQRAGNFGLKTFPIRKDQTTPSFLEKNYKLLAGAYPQAETDVMLVVNRKNQIDLNLIKALGFDTESVEQLQYDDLVGTSFRWVHPDAYYQEVIGGMFAPNTDYQTMYDYSGNLTLTIKGIIKVNDDTEISLLDQGIVYSDALSKKVIDLSKESNIVKQQQMVDYNVLTRQPIDEKSKQQILSYLGGNADPVLVTIYPKGFEQKDNILQYLNTYNQNKDDSDKVFYNDLASTMANLTQGIMDGITIVLIAFAAISLVVSLIMIGIITYTSVLERTKEIGILKALGARKKDISRVFDAETMILGLFSGTLGVVIAWLLTFPINTILLDMTGLVNVATLKLEHAVLLVGISTILTMLGGHIPARMAAKKDAVVALRTE